MQFDVIIFPMSILVTDVKTRLFNHRVNGMFNNIKLIVVAAVALIVFGGLSFWFVRSLNNNSTLGAKNSQVLINKNYTVIARVKDGRRTDGKFEMAVANAEIANSLLVQGKKARTREGKTFLIINMEIENPHPVALYIFPVDLYRLVRPDGKQLAPSVHQGAVEIRPQATKKSNIGFVIDEGEKNFKVEVGELSGEKETLEINFR